MTHPLKLLSISHSYVVALNRRLAQEMSQVSNGRWEITAASPDIFDDKYMRKVTLEKQLPDEHFVLESIPAHLTRIPQLFFYGRKLKRLLKQQPWDLVHAWEEPYVAAGFQIARWTPKPIPIVYVTAQNINKNYPPPFNMMERYTMKRSAGWFNFGQTIYDALKDRPFYKERPMCITALGVDTNHFKPDLAAGDAILKSLNWARQGPPVVGYLGRFTPEKGIVLLMDCLAQITAPWRALFVGTGTHEADLHAFAKRFPGRVHICNNVRHTEVPAYLNAMDMLTAPSQTTTHWREQFGRMLVEGFACGLPILSSDSGEIPYVMGDAGIVLGEKDHPAWIAALSELLESPIKRQEWSQRGLARAHAKYAWPVVARQHLDFFEEILQTRRST